MTWKPPALCYGPTFRNATTLPSVVEDYNEDPERTIVKESAQQEANLVCSDLQGDNDFHMPILDIDMEAQLIPSSTTGHYHLYIAHRMSWWRYKRLLKALYKAGIIQYGFYAAAKRRGYSSVRPPWSLKEEPPF